MKRIKELEAQREERQPIVTRLNELRAQEEECKASKKDLPDKEKTEMNELQEKLEVEVLSYELTL